jgi:hypothetical protein
LYLYFLGCDYNVTQAVGAAYQQKNIYRCIEVSLVMALVKNFLMGVAVAAPLVATVGAIAPVQAAPVVNGSTLNLSNSIDQTVRLTSTGLDFSSVTIPFVGTVQPLTVGGGNTGTFGTTGIAVLSVAPARIKDVTFTSGTTFTGTLTSFISGIFPTLGSANEVTFDLTSLVYNAANGNSAIQGIFRSGGQSIVAAGELTTQLELSNPTSWSMTLTAVPTPAALPALIGFGIGLVRKRKEAESTEAEA